MSEERLDKAQLQLLLDLQAQNKWQRERYDAVKKLLAELESTAEMVSPYLVAYQISKALEGTDEYTK
jgi:hypothetical protein